MRKIANEWYGLGDFSMPFIANQWAYGVDKVLSSHSRPYKYTAWFMHTMLDLEPDVSYVRGFVYNDENLKSEFPPSPDQAKSLRHLMESLDSKYTEDRNLFYRLKARENYFLLYPLRTLYLTTGYRRLELGGVKDFSGVREISSYLGYPIKFC